MNIYQVPIDNDNESPVLIATTIDKFLAMINDDLIDTENNYFTTAYSTAVLTNGDLHHTKQS